MPKVLIIGSVDKVGPWIGHLESTVLKIEAVKPSELSFDQRHGIAKCQDIYPLHLKMRILENVGFENYQ